MNRLCVEVQKRLADEEGESSIQKGQGVRALYKAHDNDNSDLNPIELIERFGMKRFAKAVMWIMQEVFGLERAFLLCEPDEREGRFILNEVMQNDNIGHQDERIRRIGSGKLVLCSQTYSTLVTLPPASPQNSSGVLCGWCIISSGRDWGEIDFELAGQTTIIEK